MNKTRTTIQRKLDQNELHHLLFKIGFTTNQLQQYEFQFLTDSERLLIKVFCIDIFVLQHEIKQLKIEPSINGMPSENNAIEYQNTETTPAKRDCRSRIEQKMKFEISHVMMKIRSQLEMINLKKFQLELEAFHIFKTVDSLAEQNSDVHEHYMIEGCDKNLQNKIFEINNLMSINNKTQNFFKDRIQNIKLDQDKKATVIEQKIKEAIRTYIGLNPNCLSEKRSNENQYQDTGPLKFEEAKDFMIDSPSSYSFPNMNTVKDISSSSKKRVQKMNSKMNLNAPSFHCRKQKPISRQNYFLQKREFDQLSISDYKIQPSNVKKRKLSTIGENDIFL